MSTEQKTLVLVVLQYSVVVKGIERKLNDAGYKASILSNDFAKIRDLAGSTDLFLLYLPSDIADNREKMDEMGYICGKVNDSGRGMIIIGEEKDHDSLFRLMPVIGDYAWINRPIEMDLLRPAIDNAIMGPEAAADKKRILIVDDDPSYARMVKEWIKYKYRVDIVTAGMQAITFLLKNKIDLILLDYEMPVVDGPQVLQMLRQEDETKDIPVIFLTGIGTKESVRRVMSLKPSGYILKSTTRDDLLEYLHNKLK